MENETNQKEVNPLSLRDYVLAIDISGSMLEPLPNGMTRFAYAEEQAVALARICAGWDSDGIDLHTFNHRVNSYPNTTPDKVKEAFAQNQPNSTTNTALVVKTVLDGYFERKAAGNAKPVTLVIITDGQPTDERALVAEIIGATQKMEKDEEIGITFLQIGDDTNVRAFLKRLDDNLVSEGAKFDIVDTKNESEWQDMTFDQILEEAVNG